MKFTTPILLLTFNRLAQTQQVFEEIRNIKPERLYLASDGPRNNNSSDSEKVKEVRNYLLSSVDWPCEVKTLFRNENMGCGYAVSSAISWFFENAEEGIVLEDDCLPHPQFFTYCEEMLNYYRTTENVKVIGGSNFQDGKRMNNASYYFSAYNHVWGWASWRRVWNQYNYTLDGMSWDILKSALVRYGFKRDELNYWKNMFEKMKAKLVDTWDYQFLFSVWSKSGFCVIPNVNLVSNIGFGAGATHTKEARSNVSNIRTNTILPLVHVINMRICRKADARYFKRKIKISLLKRIQMLLHILLNISHR